MKKSRQMMAFFVIASMCATCFASPTTQAAAKPKLSTKNMTLKIGQTKKLSVKKSKKAVKWSVTSGKEAIKLKNKKKTSVAVVGVKQGTAKVQAKIGKTKYFCKVSVQDAKNKKTKKSQVPATTNPSAVVNPPAATNPPAVVNPPAATNPPAVVNPPAVTNPPAVPTPDGSTETKINKLPENINEEDLQAAQQSQNAFILGNDTVFKGNEWMMEGYVITVELKAGMKDIKEAVPDPAKSIFSISIDDEDYQVLIRDVKTTVKPGAKETEQTQYEFKLYYYMNGSYYYEDMLIKSCASKETVTGTILNNGEKLSEEQVSEVRFENQEDAEETYYSEYYDGEIFRARVPAGTYSVSVRLTEAENNIPAGTVTIEKDVENTISLKLNVSYLNGKVTKNGNPLNGEHDLDFVAQNVEDLCLSCQTDAEGNYKIALPQGDYSVMVDSIYCAKLQVTGTESTITKDFDVKITELSLNQETDCTMSAEGMSTVFEFTPAETALYEWSILNKDGEGDFDWSIRTKYESVSSSNSLREEDKNNWKNITDEVLVEGTTYQLVLEGKDLAKDLKTSLKIEKSDLPEEIAVDQKKEWKQEKTSVISYYYTFQAPEDGTYRFAGTASQEENWENWNFVRLNLYSKAWDEKISDEYAINAETQKDGRIEEDVELKKGDTVIAYIYVNAYNMNGDFTIRKVK